MKHIAIIDCAIQSPSLPCFLKLRNTFNRSFTMHCPAHFGMKSILKDPAAGWIIFGSHSNVADHFPWQQELASFIKNQIEAKIPTLGICFGHQLMAHSFGATISKIKGPREIHQGKRTTKILVDKFGLKKDEEYSIFTSHKYEVGALSNQLECVGSSEDSEFDIISHRELPYIGIQGHPESSEYFIENESVSPMNPEDLQSVLRGGHHFMETMFRNFFK